MMAFLKNMFTRSMPAREEKNDFSEFFLHAKSNQKAKVIRQVLKEATEEQQEMIRRYKEQEKVTA